MTKMKKKIIASLLVIVMTVLALVGCGAYDFTEENLDQYVTFNYDEFKAALGKIEIEDADFTGDPETRKVKIAEKIYSSIATTVKNEASKYESDKLTTGAAGERDLVYFCYFATDADNNVYYYSNMKESTITASSTSAKHVIDLGNIPADDKDAFLAKVGEALKNYDFGADGENAYDMSSSVDLDDLKVKAGNTVIVSYNVTWNTYKAENDADGNPVIDKTYKKEAAFEKIVVDANSESELGKYLATLVAGDKNTVKVGANVKYFDAATNSELSTHKITVDGVDYTYSALKIEFLEEKAGTPVDFKYTQYTTKTEVEPDSLHDKDIKNDLKDKELTYHIYPVYRLSVPTEINAFNVIRYAIGTGLSSSGLEIFDDEAYKNGDKTVKALVEELVKVYAENYDAESDLGKLKKAYDDAAKIVKDKGDKATDAEIEAEDTTLLAYRNGQRAEIIALVEKICAATSTADGAKAITEVIVDQYKVDVEHGLKEKYETSITEAVEKAVYELLFNNEKVAKLTGKYPEKLLEDFEEQIYESYEYNFYKGKYNSTESNYAHYDGDLDKYLLDATGAKAESITIEAAITKEAKEAIGPLLILYACAKALDADNVSSKVIEYIEADIASGAYDEQTEEVKAEALDNAKNFLVTNDVFKAYKKSLGRAAYRSYEAAYGEINIRASLQFNRLFYYITSTELVKDEDAGHVHSVVTKVTDSEGKEFYYIKFRTITYSIKAEKTESESAGN